MYFYDELSFKSGFIARKKDIGVTHIGPFYDGTNIQVY